MAPNQVRIIRIGDEAIVQWSDELLVAPGEVGEITVAGPSATDAYFNREAQTRLAKIEERGEHGVRTVHRMGDVGWFDGDGRLWFCGRKSHRVETADGPLYTEQVEPVFNVHPEVRRTALVGIGAAGAQRPVLCVETVAGTGAAQHARIAQELRALGARFAHTARIDRIVFHPKFPVDIRHNAKIGRESLARWAARRSQA